MVSLKKKTKCILSPNSACVSGKLETSLPFSCVLSDGHSLPSPHCMHVAGGREKWHSGPHCYAGCSTKGWKKTEQRRIEQQRQKESERGAPERLDSPGSLLSHSSAGGRAAFYWQLPPFSKWVNPKQKWPSEGWEMNGKRHSSICYVWISGLEALYKHYI